MNDKEFVAVIRWSRVDIKDRLIHEGFKPTDENVEKVINNRLPQTIEDVSIEHGWEVIADVITMTKDLEKNEKES